MVITKKNIAIIPARGGSKRIPLKNIIDFNGKPLIVRTIEAARDSRIFDRIIVGTDSNEIAKVAVANGAEVPFLRSRFIDDKALVSTAVISILEQAEKKYQEKYANVFSLMANCPLRTAQDIKQSYKKFTKDHSDFQLSCFKYGWMNPWWAFKFVDGEPQSVFKDHTQINSQDLPPLYCPTGAIWIAKSDALKRDKTFYGTNHTFFQLNWKSAVDIDDYDDLEFAEAVYYLNEKKSQ